MDFMDTAVATQSIYAARFRPAAVRTRHAWGDYGFAAGCVGFVVLLFMWRSNPTMHWFLLSAAACGVLTGVDIVRWLRGRLDLLDPRTIIACLGFHGFFLAPLLHVSWDMFGVGDLVLFGDMRKWLGAVSCLNALGLVGYRVTHNWIFARSQPPTTHWEINRTRFYPLMTVALMLSFLGLAAFLGELQGISGLIEAYEENQAAFAGKGWLLVFAWPFAVLSFLAFVFVLTDRKARRRHTLTFGILLLSTAGIAHFVFLGWYGSRIATIAALFWMAGIVHYRFRRFPPVMMAVGLACLIGFAYFYGFYKERGREGFNMLRAPSMWLEPRGYSRDLKYLLLDDLARADSSALILHNLVKDSDGYQYRRGLTYPEAFTILVPRFLWPDRPYFRVEAGTEAIWGRSARIDSSRLYGLSGEALLNFGPLGIVPMFAVYGGMLGYYRRKLVSWKQDDPRIYLAPLITSLFVEALLCDSDVLVFFAITEGLLISLLILAVSQRKSVEMNGCVNVPLGLRV